ncbi:MAG: ATP-dependent helicase [Candidatus Vogelbacteria bacterium]|nr:ATP-dependent helicase [Candidatus Vogelbacteria bacterium]
MNEEKFNELYAKLNKSQGEAVDSIEGPVVVTAGPGTGKTQILALRIANILRKTDTKPEQILALTFTDAGVSAMRVRLASIIGVTAYRVPIFTFHGFCNEIIFRFSEYFPDQIGSKPASELDKIILMRKVFDATNLLELASFKSPYHYVKKVLGAISLLKREAMTPDELVSRLAKEEMEIKSAIDYRHEKGAHKGKVKGEYMKREDAIAKNRELAVLYKKYEEAMGKELLYDFDDMILCVVRNLERDEDLRLILQEEFQYILADEHQDANGGQNKVLQLLSGFHKSPNLFIVGDEKQAIYRFQGASIENFLYFKKAFPEVKVISLEDNYRSSQTILDVSHNLLSGEKKLISKSKHPELLILIKEYGTEEDQAEAVASEVSKKIAGGVPPEEVAIFTRTNRELGVYASALRRAGVPFVTQSKADALDDLHIEKLLVLLKAVASIGDDLSLVKALHADCFEIPELDIFILAREATRQKTSVWKMTKSVESLATLGLESPDKIVRIVGEISRWGKLGQNVTPAELVSTIARESGIVAQILSAGDKCLDKFAKLAMIISYLEEYQMTHRHACIDDLLFILDLLDEYDVLEVKSSGVATQKVKLSTAHRAKGLEFDHVYIVGAEEGVWSGGRSHLDFKLPGMVAVTKEEEEDDDRRLFYVALTRARKELEISYSSLGKNGKVVLPTRFLSDLPDNLTSRLKAPTVVTPEVIANRLTSHFGNDKCELDLKNFVRETLLDRGLSVTGLNNYLSCPWKYFYRTLLCVPESQSAPLMFGNAVHRTLKSFFDAFAEGKDLNREELVERFKIEIDKEPMIDKELAGAREIGMKSVGGYYDNYYPNWERNIKNEFPVNVTLPVLGLELRLTGKLDKIEFLDDGSVRVVDYKTGKTKTRNYIEGKTMEKGFGDYKRQLTFYKLLLDRYDKEGRSLSPSGVSLLPHFNMKFGVIDFVEPDLPAGRHGGKGRYHREEFEVTPDEVMELEETIRKSVGEILSLSFWDKTCEDKKCEYCKLRMTVSA